MSVVDWLHKPARGLVEGNLLRTFCSKKGLRLHVSSADCIYTLTHEIVRLFWVEIYHIKIMIDSSLTHKQNADDLHHKSTQLSREVVSSAERWINRDFQQREHN